MQQPLTPALSRKRETGRIPSPARGRRRPEGPDEGAPVDASIGRLDNDKPVASICHGPWTIIETGAARGRRMASWPSLQTDLRNAGAEWVDESAVVDGNLMTSRNPGDIPVFNCKMIALFAAPAGVGKERRVSRARA